MRVLVDDLNTVGEDRRFLHLSEHANVEVRVFNPFPGGRFATWTRFVASASDIRRINHRMHNKLFVADNALAITGGRNIGDEAQASPARMEEKSSSVWIFRCLSLLRSMSYLPLLSFGPSVTVSGLAYLLTPPFGIGVPH